MIHSLSWLTGIRKNEPFLEADGLQQASLSITRQLGEELIHNWHCHPEVDIIYIQSGEGVSLIGDYVGRFQAGDVIMLGPNVPHCFRYEPVLLGEEGINKGGCVCATFLPDIMGGTFLNRWETADIRKLLQLACHGIKIKAGLREEIAGLLREMPGAKPAMRLILLFTILDSISGTNDFEILSSNSYSNHHSIPDQSRIKKVLDYTMAHYGEKIYLNSVAALIHMSSPSFCRFFKNKTGQSYFQFLTEVRIWNACRLLLEDDLTVAEISFMCGYNNVSHFNHLFKELMKKSPLNYKKSGLNRSTPDML